MAQLTYTAAPAAAFEGQLADLNPLDIISRNAEVAIPRAGVLVVAGTDLAAQAKLPTVTGDVTGKYLGVVILQVAKAQSSTTVAYDATETLSILRKGRVWVRVEEAVNAMDAAFVRFASGAGGTILGSFRKSADTATAVALPGARFLTTQATIGGLAIVELTLA